MDIFDKLMSTHGVPPTCNAVTVGGHPRGQDNRMSTTENESVDADHADGEAPGEVAVAARVRVTLDDGSTREGEVVDDFADLAGDTTVETRIDDEHTARLRRWAISTDDHQIVFADDDAVEVLAIG